MSAFEKHLLKLLDQNPKASMEYAKLFAELPLTIQLGIMRRRRNLTQRAMAKKMKVPQPHVARTESPGHDPRISSILKAAKAIKCHVVLIPDENLQRIAAA